MGEKTGIGWTDHTWNPWQGCSKVSPGCKHCYMFTQKARYGQDPTVVVRSAPTTFNAPLSKYGARSTKGTPGAWKWADGSRVFTCSWSDFFHETADAWRPDAWAIMRQRPGLTFQVLTKRPDRIREHLPDDWGDGYPNVILGTTAENQAQAEERIPQLLDVPAAGHFVSVEPMLGEVDLSHLDVSGTSGCTTITLNALSGYLVLQYADGGFEHFPTRRLSWVIVGGESGPKARPFDLGHVSTMVALCWAFRVPLFVKQLGERWAKDTIVDGKSVWSRGDRHGEDPRFWPKTTGGFNIREFPLLATDRSAA